jgi:subtilisin family serine protease
MPAEEAGLQAEQRQIDPTADGSEVRLIVRLNPAAVTVNERATMLGAGSTGESPSAAALQEARLATKASAVASTAQAVMARAVLQAAPGAVVRQQFAHAVEGFVVTVPWAQAQAVADALAQDVGVDAVEPDRLFRVGQTTGVRTLDARAWGVDRIDQRARTFDNSFRQRLTGAGVNVYVMDTGVSPHNEFGSRLVAGSSAVNDGRGTLDCNGHGTHVAGSAAGATLGVAAGARVVPVRVMDCNGSGSGSAILAGIDWVAARGVRPGVVNLSLGGSASSTLDAAVQRLVTTGYTVVAAAGNSNVDACTQSPARAAGLVTVAATDRNDAKASFSNWGSCVALSAPGVGIASAGHGAVNAVVTMNGTSMAAPHAAGAAALLLQASPAAAPATVRQQLLANATANAVSGAPANTARGLLYAGTEGSSTGIAPAPAPTVRTVSLSSLAPATKVPAIGLWSAAVTVRAVDQNNQPVTGARVAARYANSSSELACTTDTLGQCVLNSAAVNWALTPVLGLAITGVQGSQLAYTGGGLRSVQVARPAAPVARITALTGSMVRSTPTAADWVPQFTAMVKDGTGANVGGALVQATLQVHAGASVVGVQTVSCETSAVGQCVLRWTGPRLNATHTGARVQVQNVQRLFLSYTAGPLSQATVGRTN